MGRTPSSLIARASGTASAIRGARSIAGDYVVIDGLEYGLAHDASAAQIAAYLDSAAERMGPYIYGRPVSLVRAPDGGVASFNDLQQRLNRKKVDAKMMQRYPAFIRAYDLLADGAEDLRGLPFSERRKRLEQFVHAHGGERLVISPLVDGGDWDTLARHRAEAPEGVEGLMLKRWDSLYESGRPKGLWFKWKRDPFTADCVLMYAQRGSGKRSSFYSDYTFGCWRGDELLPVGKAYFGFTDEELAQLDKFVRDHTTDRFGPVRQVHADRNFGLVLEVAFEGIARSARHKSGVALRFPRISRIRWDKPAREADELATLEALIDKS